MVVVGGGQAGVSLSYYLQQLGVEHTVLERDRAFSAWMNRWDDFITNTPNWMNTLPMLSSDTYPANDPEGFASREEMVSYLDRCLRTVDPPILTNTEVRRVVHRGPWSWSVYTDDTEYQSSFVAICTGAMSSPRLPEAAVRVPAGVPQMHSSEYRSPSQIETGGVLVVGSASSGIQICRLLAESRRFKCLNLATSRVTVLPRRVLSIQTHRFLNVFGLFDVRRQSLLGRIMYSGLESKGDPIMRPSPKDLARRYGVILRPKLVDVERGGLRFADGRTLQFEDLTVIWCTGFRGDYGFIETQERAGAFDGKGVPRHARGIVDAAPGLCFVGLRYQHTVASHDIYGVAKDAEYVANHVDETLRRNRGVKVGADTPAAEFDGR